MVKSIFIVGMGSFAGGALRYLVSRLFESAALTAFPLATLAVNAGGCFLIGLINGLAENGGWISEDWRTFLTVGLCGGFTTFSTFANENYRMARDGCLPTAALYVAASLLAGFLLVWAGYRLAKSF